MKIEKTIIIALSLFVMLLLPIKLKSKVVYDLFSNKGYLSIFLYKIKLTLFRWKLKKNRVELNKNNKTKTFTIFNRSNQPEFGEIFVKQFLKVIYINNLRLIYHFGFNKDRLITSIGGALLNIVSYNFIGALSENNKLRNYDLSLFINDNKTILIIALTCSIKFNLLLMGFCFVKSVIIKIKKRLV